MPPAAASPNPFARCPLQDAVLLGDLYDNNRQPRNQADLKRLQALSAAALSDPRMHHRALPFGDLPWQWLDVFQPAQTGGVLPALVFVHGGRWQLNTSRDTAFWAAACAAAGVAFVGINFPPLSSVGLRAQIDGVAAALRAAHHLAGSLNVDPAALCLAGHSSGAHLALSALLRETPLKAALPWQAVLLLGGIYDLAPLQRTRHQQTLDFSDADVAAGSPLRTLSDIDAAALPPLMVAVGADESPEFVRQAKALHWALQTAGARAAWHAVPDAAHFDAALEFNRPASVLRRFVLQGEP